MDQIVCTICVCKLQATEVYTFSVSNEMLKQTKERTAGIGDVTRLVECVPNMHEDLCSIPRSAGNQVWWSRLAVSTLGRQDLCSESCESCPWTPDLLLYSKGRGKGFLR